MTINKDKGYPLPAGDAEVADLACQLVWLPNDDAYWQALLGTLTYLSTWLAWERDDDHNGKKAADSWKAANVKTLECWRMTCLEDLETNVAAILALLQGRKDCCDDNVTYLPQTEYTTDIEPEEGDAPDYYGETAVTDWDDWLEHVCYNAHLYVDYLVQQAEQLNDAVGLGMLTLGLVASGLALLSFGPLGIPVAFALVSTTLFGLIAATALAFDDAAEDIEDARTDIVCALLQGTSLGDAVEDAIGSSSPEWTYFFSLVDYDSAQAIMYEGGADGEYLPAETKDDCVDCGYDQLLEGDITLKVPSGYGTGLSYADGVWTISSQSVGACHVVWIQFFTDITYVTPQAVLIEVLTCSGSASLCVGLNHHRGFDNPETANQYNLAHPTLPAPSDGEIEQLYDLHSSSWTMTFRLYEPA